MIKFLFQKGAVKRLRKYVNGLNPKINVNIPNDYPFSSIKMLKKKCEVASRINALEKEISNLSDEQLAAKTQSFQERYPGAIKKESDELKVLEDRYYGEADAESREALVEDIEKAEENLKKVKQDFIEGILPEAFAVVREAGVRVLNMRHYDVQMIGGMVLNEGNIAEMTTGEGKTLVATLPAYLNALTGEGVHIITVNDYLAKRDKEWMGPLFEFLGLTVGVVISGVAPQERKAAYNCDVLYGTNNEFGFDYLRDNMVSHPSEMVQRRHHFTIVDEVDSILVDEARTPLIISGPAEESTDKYYKAHGIAGKLKGHRVTEADEIQAKHDDIDLAAGYDYLADEKSKNISLTEEGEDRAAKLFGVDNLHDMETVEYRHHVMQSLSAKEFFKVDIDYVIQNGEVIIVDEFTGRLMPGRRWSNGLHQAVEAKEGIKIARENQTLATITFQNYFRLYEKLSGMTGTATTEATEFKEIYDLDCVVMPTNKELQRQNYGDAIYRSVAEKFEAVVDEVEEYSQRGQPVLVGTISIERSEILSNIMKQRGLEHKVLNAKFHEQESNIISQAGRWGRVTIATNMAGRGTDIVLGGNAEILADTTAKAKFSKSTSDEEKEKIYEDFLKQYKEELDGENVKVVGVGGLHVIGTERHESRRIDNQLRGRQGRQGDPGSSKFFVSLEDDLMRLFASDKVIAIMDKLGMEEGSALEHPWLSKAIETAQRRVEGQNFEVRKHLIEYDNVMNKQREVIYDLRREVLRSEDVKDHILEAIEGSVDDAIRQYLFMEKGEEEWNVDGLDNHLKNMFHYSIEGHKSKISELSESAVKELILKELFDLYDHRENEFEPGQMRMLERAFLLQTIDKQWKEHLYEMDQLKDSVSLRSFGQRDPLVEYKKEGFFMFEQMYASISRDVAEIIFKIQPIREGREVKNVFGDTPQQMVHKEIGNWAQSPAGGSRQQTLPPQRSEKSKPIVAGPKVGRNDPCPCGSGKKYKKCHGVSV